MTKNARKNPADVRKRVPHANTTQQEGDTNGVFRDLFRSLADMEQLPNGFEAGSLSYSDGLLDGAFIVFNHSNVNASDVLDFISWVSSRARTYGLYVYPINNIPAKKAGFIVLRVYMQ